MSWPQFDSLGECSLIVRWEQRIDQALNARVHALATAIAAAALPGIEEIVPGYASLLLSFDPASWGGLRADPHEALRARIEPLLQQAYPALSGEMLEIEVRYGGADGPDLVTLANTHGLDPHEFVARHCAPTYQVAMLGFAPGFPYLLGLDASLHSPRRSTPRVRVPAGSVAIGGSQTGIYPSELPGGWHLIGRTQIRLFDAARNPPCLLKPGDRVRFVPISGPAGAGSELDA